MSARSRKPAPDQAQRDAAIRERVRNVLIDAGAGTGKTTILVDRLVEMGAPQAPTHPTPGAPPVPINRMAAITFTRKAAGELRLRIRERLLEALAEPDLAPEREAPLREALADLDTAYVGTIHSFADRLLRLRPVEAALSPAYQIVEDDEDLVRETWEVLLHAVQSGTPPAFDTEAFRAAAGDFTKTATPVQGTSSGARWIRNTAARLLTLSREEEPAVLLRDVRRAVATLPKNLKKGQGFANDKVAWKAWNQIKDTTLPALRAPLDRWMATRLARLHPVGVALYEKVKARRQVLYQLDLHIKLRDLLARNREVRRELQGLFDHIFVDEFQDTDPLQAEIVLLLCERGADAARWAEVALREGSLTLVGDPKQSIYRFRRADVAMYERVRQVVMRGAHLPVQLSANFRSAPSLISWLNDRFEGILGPSPAGRPFDARNGVVFHQTLAPGREGTRTTPVHVLACDFPDARKHTVEEYRALEGEALARYLRWLVEVSDAQVADPLTGQPRRVQYGDVAVLAVSTWNLPLLFEHLDAEGVPYASRGGRLFLADLLSRQFLLGLRALADRGDGVAEAALLRPPFFALALADLLRERAAAAGRVPEDEAVRRVREAKELIGHLRRRRLDRPPGALAAFARAVALGPNGAQRLARLRELCLVLEQTAAAEGFDYDGATARLREWVTDPVQLDPPHPVGAEAVQVLTVHQAKGLEFPVVVLWDGRGEWDPHPPVEPWRMERDGRGWTMSLEGLAWEEPPGLELTQTERDYLRAERRRVIYVAATRARDLLVIPKTGAPTPGKMVCADLLGGAEAGGMRVLDTYISGSGATWARQVSAGERGIPGDAMHVFNEIAGRWEAAAQESARPRFRPVAVSEARATLTEREPIEEPAQRKSREGRFGPLFGSAVHQAIGLLLRDPALGPAEAVRRGAALVGLTDHLDEAIADVGRAWQALQAEGLARRPGPGLQLEYPVAAAGPDGTLLMGYVDLIAATADRLDVLDFKTDAPPALPVQTAYPEYVAQVSLYGRLLPGIVGARDSRLGLLFTADGGIRWVEPRSRL